MKYRNRVLAVVLAVLLIAAVIIPVNLAVWANNGYISEDCSTKNTYDEDITYSSEEIKADGKLSYTTARQVLGDGEYKLSHHGKFEENSGVDGSNAIRFYQVRGSSDTDKDVSYIRIFDSEDSNYNWFVPDSYSKYKVKISYKSENNYNFILREVGTFGEISYTDENLSVFSNQAVDGDWNIAQAEITVSNNPKPLYIAVVTQNGECDSEAEVYIDDIAVMLPEVIENPNAPRYTSAFNNIDAIKADGWKGFFSSDPQAGVAFSEIADNDYGTYYDTWGGNVIARAQKSGLYNGYNNWNNKYTFSNMAALTYTAQKYKYFKLTIDYKFNGNDVPWPAITFNQQNETPEMFYKTSSTVTNPSYSEDPIGVFYEFEGNVMISGKKVTYNKAKASDTTSKRNGWRKAEITVLPNKVNLKVYDSDLDGANVVVDYTTELIGEYEGGYITLMQNGVSLFKNISITEFVFETETISDTDYSSDFNNIDAIKAEGWKGFFSQDPQSGVAFSEISDYSQYYETWGGNVITRAQKPGLYNGYNNWNNKYTFSNMAALTYTARKYKYFKLTIDYKFNGKDVPWPVVTFNQQSLTPEMFYFTNSQITNPTYSEDVIGVVPQFEGHLRIYGKLASAKKNIATQMDEKGSPQWHKLEITVLPGSVYTAVYDKDGNLALELTSDLEESYEGGYIALMQNGVSLIKNVSIIGYEHISMEQNEDSEVTVIDLDEIKTNKTLLVSTKSKRWYDFKSISAVSEKGISYKISEFGTNLYKIESTKPIRLTVTYQKRELDYNPEYELKYYFDWQEELEDFSALRTPHPDEATLENVEVSDIWKISNNILSKPNIDVSDTSKASSAFADMNVLMLDDIKFRNFELTLQYKHGKTSGYAGGVIFGINDPNMFCNEKDGGIFAMVEADARATLYGKSLRNADVQLRPGEGLTNIPGYPKWDTTQVHTMKIKVLDGKVEMFIDDVQEPVVGMIPKDYYGYIALAVGNNKGWFDNLTIQPLDEWGNKISLAENEKQSEFSGEDIETDTWTDNSEWD